MGKGVGGFPGEEGGQIWSKEDGRLEIGGYRCDPYYLHIGGGKDGERREMEEERRGGRGMESHRGEGREGR